MKKTIQIACAVLMWSLHSAYAVAQAKTPPNNQYYYYAAYDAMANHSESALRYAISKGGDATRYARTNPAAIYDAVRSNRDIATLAFVLKNGADANVKHPTGVEASPLSYAGMDLAKVELLIKAGAGIDGKSGENRTPLANALAVLGREFKFLQTPKAGEPQRTYSKLEVVRFLINAGAKLSDVQGSGGQRSNMLTFTAREDKEIIALLLSKGATINAGTCMVFAMEEEKKIDCGPLLTLAIANRDDLGIALLRRDKLIAKKDRLALLHATRRGLNDFALALLQAGADPLATDDEGNTPLMWARKFRSKQLIDTLLKAGSPNNLSLPKVSFEREGLNKFDMQAGVIIDDVAAMDSPRFGLDMGLPKRGAPVFALYGAAPNQYASITCENASAFEIINNMNALDGIQVGVCKKGAAKVLALVKQSRETFKKQLELTTKGFENNELTLALDLKWRENLVRPDGQSFEFPIVAIGHGISTTRTFVLINKAVTSAVIVQASINRLCEGARLKTLNTPLCSDASRAFEEIAERVSKLVAMK